MKNPFSKIFSKLALCVIISITYLLSPKVHAQNIDKALMNGKKVLKAMYQHYEGAWYTNLIFKQKTTFFNNDGSERNVQDWYEALQIPTGLAIKFGSDNSGFGLLFNEGKRYTFQNGNLSNTQDDVHDLLILGFMIYGQPHKQTVREISSNGYDLETMYTTTYKGREMYVVGASGPNDKSNHFYIDMDRMVFIKLVKYEANDVLLETEFEEYHRLEGGWIAPIVRFYRNGVQTLLEEYQDIAAPESLPTALFDPETFIETKIPIK